MLLSIALLIKKIPASQEEEIADRFDKRKVREKSLGARIVVTNRANY
jgi:hypothetical protein